ncbi:MAG: hypothetical protein GX370_06440 [Clostridia bacterium]|nr:hypothetical protein [Clostridia bacterium]
MGSGGTIFNGMVMQYSLFVILLYVLGIILHGHNTVFNNHDNLLYSPLAQGILSMHYPFYYQGLNNLTDISKVMERFNVGYSIVYLSVLLVLLLLVGFIRIRNMNLVVKDDKL